jgi:ADP-ribose pyrophosphatase
MPNQKNPWTKINTDIKYDNPWISVSEHKVLKPNGEPGLYGLVHFKNVAIGVLALDTNDHVLLVGQYRYALERYSWELPEGGCPDKEQPLDAAKRELEEETGYRAKTWKKILDLDLSNSSTDERAIVYLATNLTVHEASPEDTEVLTIKSVPLMTAVEMVLRGEITDGISVAALLYAGLKKDELGKAGSTLC